MDAAEGGRDAVGMLGAVDAGIDQRLGHRAIDGEARIERVERVLEDELRLAPEIAQPLAVEAGQRHAVEDDRARRRLGELQQQAAERGLAAARFAHDGDGVAGAQVEAHAVERVHGRVLAAHDLAQRARDGEVFYDVA